MSRYLVRNWTIFIGVSRIPFLALTLVVVSLGAALAYSTTGTLPASMFALVLVCALSAHIAVNSLNEYYDFRSGLDRVTYKTPFSGGSGTLPKYPDGLINTLVWSVFCLGLCVITGLFILYETGPVLLGPGVLGLVIVVFYTPYINRQPWLCLLAPGTAFGFVMLPGTTYALGGQVGLSVVVCSIAVFMLVNNLLLLNQLPDREADGRFGRRTFPVVYGWQHSVRAATLMYALALLTPLAGVLGGRLPRSLMSIWALLPLIVWTLRCLQARGTGGRLHQALGVNVLINLLAPVLLAVGLLV